jgi:hypothetical protein
MLEVQEGTQVVKHLISLLLKIFDVEPFTRGIVKKERMEDSELRSGSRKRSPK